MKFLITSSSNYLIGYCNKVPALQKATLERVPEYEVYTPDYLPTNWFLKGSNHCGLPNGDKRRQMGFKEAYTMEVSSLDELLELAKFGKMGIVVSCPTDELYPVIEIYDTMRE